MPVQRFDRQGLPASPWKNGGGVTHEVACWPVGAGLDAFDWRVSIAHICHDGPFSAFDGVDRVITLLDGAGVRLHTPGGGFDHRLDTPLAPLRFAGEVPIQAELLDGGCHDFNVMTRRAVCRADVRVLRNSVCLPATSQGLLMAVNGPWRGRPAGEHNGQVLQLEPGAGLWWHKASMAWDMATPSTDAALLAVLITAVHADHETP